MGFRACGFGLAFKLVQGFAVLALGGLGGLGCVLSTHTLLQVVRYTYSNMYMYR